MNTQQLQQVRILITQLKDLDIEEKVVNSFGDPSVFESKLINGTLTVAEFVDNHQKLIPQFEAEFENGSGKTMPFSYNFQNEFGNGHIVNALQQYFNYLSQNAFPNAESVQLILIHYQRVNGFWDRSKLKLHNVKAQEIKSLESRVKEVQAASKEQLKEQQSRSEELKKVQEELAEFLKNSKIQLQEVSSQHQAASTQLQSINTSTNEATKLKGQIENILDQQKQLLEDLQKKLDKEGEAYDEFNKKNTALQNQLNKRLEEIDQRKITFDEFVEYVKNQTGFIEAKREDIIKLTGMAADASLGARYHKREGDLLKGLSFWKWAVPIISIVAILWVIVVFTWLQTKTDNTYLDLVINLLKTSPAFVLMGFVFSQYNKERNIQEEYAFKSAVAMTITAYSDLLKGEDNDQNRSRQEMIKTAVSQVHLPPKLYSEKSSGFIGSRSKELNETIRNLTEVLKSLK